MLEKILTTVAANAKLALAATAGAALVAGGSAVAINNVASSGDAPTVQNSVATGQLATHSQGDENRSDTATAVISAKPTHSPEANNGNGPANNHGACVSAFAKATPAPSASPNAHGKTVSAAARTDCGKTAATTTQQGATTHGKSSLHKPAGATAHNDGTDASESPEPSDSPDATETADSGAPNSNSTTHGGGHHH